MKELGIQKCFDFSYMWLALLKRSRSIWLGKHHNIVPKSNKLISFSFLWKTACLIFLTQENCMLFGICAVPLIFSMDSNRMGYYQVLSNSNCLLVFSFREKKAEVYGWACPTRYGTLWHWLEEGVHMSFTVVVGMVPMMVRVSLGWTWNARHKLVWAEDLEKIFWISWNS